MKTPVPTLGLFWVGPLLLVVSFVYFHLYLQRLLQRLWETLAELPAILPDGAAIDERVDPWVVTSLIRRCAYGSSSSSVREWPITSGCGGPRTGDRRRRAFMLITLHVARLGFRAF